MGKGRAILGTTALSGRRWGSGSIGMEGECVRTYAGRDDDAGTWAEQKGFIDVAAATLELPPLRPTIFVLGSLGLVDVVWVHLLVLLLPLLRHQVIPLLADDLGEISLTLIPPGPPGDLRNTCNGKG